MFNKGLLTMGTFCCLVAGGAIGVASAGMRGPGREATALAQNSLMQRPGTQAPTTQGPGAQAMGEKAGTQAVSDRAELAALRGLAPVAALMNSGAGEAALAANLTITGGMETGEIRQSTLLPFEVQRQQALQDAYTTGGNLAQLADGLGTTLGAGYLARAHMLDRTRFTSISTAVSDLIAYAGATSGGHSGAGKYFFANGTTNGKKPVSAEAMSILTETHGVTDVFGKSYGLMAGSPGADQYGNSRPFQTEATTAHFVALDYFNVLSDNGVYNHGAMMDLTNSPSYPSGHTTYGYTGAVVLAVMVPERYQQMITRGAEYGNDRILVGAHYAMDVMGGRTLALYDMAHLLGNDVAYIGRTHPNGESSGTVTIKDFRTAVQTARADVRKVLEAACGKSIEECAGEDTGRLSDAAADEAFYNSTQTYGLPQVHTKTAGRVEDVGKVAPEAGNLLTAAFPELTLEEADRILTETEGPGGGFLDDGSGFGVYSRLNLMLPGVERRRWLPPGGGVGRSSRWPAIQRSL